ncbi:MAG: DUF3102 domain-containing protein [Phascolarctobacterium sp.]|nr:DUF3102 domain-containing protein [Phascolarctobacterium sp.]
MNEVQVLRTPQIVAAEINEIRRQTQNIVLFNSIEIGRRLVEAKGMMEHGKFGVWLQESVAYSQSTANNLMKIFEEYGSCQITMFGDNANSQTFGNLSYSQAVALLGIPKEERETFVEEHHAEELSISELKTEIKRYKEAKEQSEKQLDGLEKKNKEMAQALKYHEEEAIKLRTETTMAKNDKELQAKKMDKLKSELHSLREEAEKNKAVAAELEEAKKRVKELEQEINKPVTVETVKEVVEKVPDEILAELDRLRADAKANAMDKAELAKTMEFKTVFKALQADFNQLISTASAMVDSEVKKKHFGAIEKLTEQIGKIVADRKVEA